MKVSVRGAMSDGGPGFEVLNTYVETGNAISPVSITVANSNGMPVLVSDVLISTASDMDITLSGDNGSYVGKIFGLSGVPYLLTPRAMINLKVSGEILKAYTNTSGNIAVSTLYYYL